MRRNQRHRAGFSGAHADLRREDVAIEDIILVLGIHASKLLANLCVPFGGYDEDILRGTLLSVYVFKLR